MSDEGSETTDNSSGEREVQLSGALGPRVRTVRTSISLSLSTSFALWHLQSAALFAQQGTAIEARHIALDADNIEDARAEHRAYVTGAIFVSVAFLEATINEFFAGSSYASGVVAAALGDSAAEEMRNEWLTSLAGKSGYSALEKYQRALEIAKKPQLPEPRGTYPPSAGTYHDVEELIGVRNGLIHYEPLWESTQASESRSVRRLKKQLRARFSRSPNPLYVPTSHFLHRYLSAACARWAVTTSRDFTDGFFSELGLPAPYEHIRSKVHV